MKKQIRLIILFALGLFYSGLPAEAKGRRPQPVDRVQDNYDLGEAENVDIPAREAEFPLYVYGHPTGKNEPFSPSGLMGDVSALQKITSAYDASSPVSVGRSNKTSLQIRYLPKGKEGWAGLYWLTPANNWGKRKGAGYDLSQAAKLSFWIRGENGGEKLADVKVGGVTGPYPDSDTASLGPLKVEAHWERYEIPLEGKDLRHIVGGFAILFRRADNPRGATIFLDDIKFVAADHVEPPVEPSTPAAEKKAAVPAETPVPTPQPETTGRTFIRTILFSSAQSGFTEVDKVNLAEFIEEAKKYPSAPILVEGHTDNVGPAELNKKLSERRAKTIKDLLLDKGISPTRVSVVGYGEERPVATNNSAAGRKQNRRARLVLTPG